MTVIALTRHSTKQQNSKGQKSRIKLYAEQKKLAITKWVELNGVSASKTSAKDRGWYDLIDTLKEGDKIITTEISRISRDKDSGEIFYALQTALRKGITLVFTDNRVKRTLKKGDTSSPAVIFPVIAESVLASEFSKQRSLKQKAAMKRRTKAGLLNGRLPGYLVTSKIDKHESEIIRLMSEGINKKKISDKLGFSRSTFMKWLKKREEIKQTAEKEGIDNSLPLTQIKSYLNQKTLQSSASRSSNTK